MSLQPKPTQSVAKKRVAVLISGTGTNMLKLIEATRSPHYPAEIVLVLSNKPGVAGLDIAQTEGVPAKHLKWTARDAAQQKAFEEWVTQECTAARVDLICCAGFMRILSGAFVNRYKNKILNIHPSLLPAFPGLDTHERALQAGVKFAGCTVHLMREEMDTGPIIIQAATRVLPDDTAETLYGRIRPLEHKIFPAALELIASGQFKITGNKVVPLNRHDTPIETSVIEPAPKYARAVPKPTFPPSHDLPLLMLAPPESQKMPRSLGLTLRAMRVMAGMGTADMASKLNDDIGRFNPREMRFNKQSLSLLEQARTGTQNWHIEAFQNWSYVPTSCIDLIAHIGADLRDNNIDGARALARTVKEMCERIETHAAALRDRAINAHGDSETLSDKITFEAAYDESEQAAINQGREPASAEQKIKDVIMMLLAQQLIEMFVTVQVKPLRKIRVPKPPVVTPKSPKKKKTKN